MMLLSWLPWLKALHVAAAVTFTAGLLLLGLLARLQPGLPAPAWPQERRLLLLALAWNRRVTGPALLLLWALGIALALRAGWFGAPWLTAKLVLVLALSGLHGVLTGRLRLLAAGQGEVPVAGASRWAFGAAAVSVGVVVLLAVAKPG